MDLVQTGFGFEQEFTLKLARKKEIRVYEVGISYAGRSYEEGKKIRWTDGLKDLHRIVRYGLGAKK